MPIEITKKEGDLIMLNYPHQLYASVEKSNGNYDLEVPDVDKFRKFLCNEFNLDDLDCDKNWNLKSIISKLDKMKQNTNKYNNISLIINNNLLYYIPVLGYYC